MDTRSPRHTPPGSGVGGDTRGRTHAEPARQEQVAHLHAHRVLGSRRRKPAVTPARAAGSRRQRGADTDTRAPPAPAPPPRGTSSRGLGSGQVLLSPALPGPRGPPVTPRPAVARACGPHRPRRRPPRRGPGCQAGADCACAPGGGGGAAPKTTTPRRRRARPRCNSQKALRLHKAERRVPEGPGSPGGRRPGAGLWPVGLEPRLAGPVPWGLNSSNSGGFRVRGLRKKSPRTREAKALTPGHTARKGGTRVCHPHVTVKRLSQRLL